MLVRGFSSTAGGIARGGGVLLKEEKSEDQWSWGLTTERRTLNFSMAGGRILTASNCFQNKSHVIKAGPLK